MDGNRGLIEYQNDIGQTPFLMAAPHCQGNTANMLEVLVSRGTNIHAKDVRGRDALFTLFDLGPVNHDGGSHLDSVRYLFNLGLDKSTTDRDGRTIFDVVYAYTPEKDPVIFDHGSHKRDLWFSALEHHSRSISDSTERRSFDDWKTTYHRMRSVYTRWYTPFHHRALLRGDPWDIHRQLQWISWFDNYLLPEDLDEREEHIILHQALIFGVEHETSGRLDEPTKMWSHGVEIEINLDDTSNEGYSPMENQEECIISEVFEEQSERSIADSDEDWSDARTLLEDEEEETRIEEHQDGVEDTEHGQNPDTKQETPVVQPLQTYLVLLFLLCAGLSGTYLL